MIDIIKLFTPILDRLVNKYTTKGLLSTLIGLIVLQISNNEELTKWVMEQDFSPILNLLVISISEHPLIMTIIGLIILSIGGFYIWRRDLNLIQFKALEHELKCLELKKAIIDLKKENSK
jgi:hypothetical protein